MPRSARKMSSTQTYHVVIKGADRQMLFEEMKDYIKYLEILEYFKKKCNFELFAYCLMSNHVHLLIRSLDVPISSIFRRINTTYAIWFNQKYHRTGFVQDGRFFSEPVEDTRYLLTVVRYIHFNPQKAGLEAAPGEKYLWSSFKEYLMPHSDLVDADFILNIIGGVNSFLDFHQSSPSEECLDIKTARRRIPDDIAREIIRDICNCETVSDFQNFSLLDREHYIQILKKEGLSIRQLNRLTGVSRGSINRILSLKNEPK